MTTGTRTEGVRGIGSDGFVRTVSNLTITGDLTVIGETRSQVGTGSAFWETADANANYWAFEVPAGGSDQVPVMALGIGLDGVDLGLFNGITQSTFAVVDADRDSAVAITFSADDVARINLLGSATQLELAGDFLPSADDTYDLGSASAAWQDLFIEGDITMSDAGSITTSAGALTLNPATDVFVANAKGFVVGHTAFITGAGGTTSEMQVLGTAAYEASILLANFQNSANGPTLIGVTSQNTVIGSNTIVQDGDSALSLRAGVDDGTDYNTIIGRIQFEVDGGTPAENDVLGRIIFKTNAGAASDTEALRIDSGGNVGIGATSFGTSSKKVLALVNGTAPAGSITNGVLVYAHDTSTSSELKVRDEAGNITTLSPHSFTLQEPSEPMAWSFHSRNDEVGKLIEVDMMKVVRALERLTGEQFVYEENVS